MEGRKFYGGLGAAVTMVSAVLTAMLLGRYWNACDVGVNNAANGGFLMFLFIPGLWVLLLLNWFAVGALLGNRPPLHAGVLVVTTIAVVWCAISVFWDAPGPHCPHGVPPWWPGFVPSPGF